MRTISSRSSGPRPAVAKAITSRITSVGIRGVVHQRLGADGDLVAEHGGDLVGVAGAADVPQQRHPVGGLAHLVLESRGLADPRREQARPQLRLERLPERVVLRERERRDELAEAKRCVRRWGVLPMYGPPRPGTILARRVAVVAPSDKRSLRRRTHGGITDPGGDPIKVGVITDQTGPLSVIGLANANVARMVVGDINAKGGLLGRHLELHLEDSATDDAVAAAKATKLVEHDHVDVIFGGIYSSTRQAIKGPAVVEGKTLYIYPEQYEGQESDPLIFCTGPVPAQQVDPFIPWLMRETGAKTFYLPSADYIWPHVMNARVREVVTANGGEIVGEEYFPLDHADYRATVDRIAVDRRGRGLQHDRAARGRTVPRAAARLRLRRPRRTPGLHVLRGEPPEHCSRRRTSTGCTAASTTTRRSAIRSASGSSPSTTRSIPATRSSPAAAGLRACTAGCSCGRPPSRKRARSRRRT